MSVPRGAAFAFPALGVQVRIETQLCGSATVESLTISVCVCLLPCKQSRVGDGSATEYLPCKREDLSLVPGSKRARFACNASSRGAETVDP